MPSDIKKESLYMLKLMEKAATSYILPLYGKVKGTIKAEIPGFIDLVTEADIKASSYILEHIRAKYPGSYSEEHLKNDRYHHDLIWQIDPIDGTLEFVRQFAEGYTMLAALLKKDIASQQYKPILGLIYQPATKKAYIGNRQRAFKLEKNEILPLEPIKNHGIVGYQRKVDPHPKLNECYEEIARLRSLPLKMIYSGGSGSSVIDLIEGRVNLIIMNSNLCKDWDTGMAEPIIEAMGGFICSFDGAPLQYNQKIRKGFDQPYHHRGVVMSITLKKEEVLTYLRKDLFIDRLSF